MVRGFTTKYKVKVPGILQLPCFLYLFIEKANVFYLFIEKANVSETNLNLIVYFLQDQENLLTSADNWHSFLPGLTQTFCHPR